MRTQSHPSFIFKNEYWRLCCLFGVVAGVGLSSAQAQKTFTIRGTVEAHGSDRSHRLTVLNARVWVMKQANSKEVSEWYSDDKPDGTYKIEELEAKDYDLVACEITAKYKPKRLRTHVPSDDDIPFVLDASTPSNGQILEFKEASIVYLKHIETGCEPPPLRTTGVKKQWTLQLGLDPGAFEEEYVYCRETDNGGTGSGSYEKCLDKAIKNGQTQEEVEAAIGAPQSTDRNFSGTTQVYIYTKEHLRITFKQGLENQKLPKNQRVFEVSAVEKR